jgi:hypothetical protein
MSERIFVKAFRTFAKREGSPDFVLGSLLITIDEFKEFINGEGKQYLSDYDGKKQLRLDILEGKDGRVNFQVNTYKKESGLPEGDIQPSQETKDRVATAKKLRAEQKDIREGNQYDVESDLPF